MLKKILIGIIVILLLFGICAELEKQTTPDGSTPMTEQLITETVNGFSEAFGQIKDGLSEIVSSIADNFAKDDEASVEIGEVSVDELPDDAQECYNRYKEDNWETTSNDLAEGMKAGKKYKNKSKALPMKNSDGENISYKEYDAEYPNKDGNRGTKRFVHGSDGSTYYTDDHYETFKKVQ